MPRTRWHRDPTWEIAFSREPEQRFIYLTDGQNERVRIVRRDTMTELLRSAAAGASRVHSIAVDSKATSTRPRTYEGKRIQKFVFKGIGHA